MFWDWNLGMFWDWNLKADEKGYILEKSSGLCGSNCDGLGVGTNDM